MSAVGERLYALRRALAMVARHPGRFLVGTVLAGTALALPLAAAALAHAAATAWSAVTTGPEISVFARGGTSSRDFDALRVRLAAMEGVSGIRVIPRDQALAELSKRSGLSAAPSDGRPNPLPDTLVARYPMTVDPAVIDRAAERIRQWSSVDSVQSDIGWYRRLAELRRVGLAVAASLAMLTSLLVGAAVLGSVLLVGRLRRDEVRVLQWVGARPSFVRRPYAYAGAMTLAAGALLALALAWAALLAISSRLDVLPAMPPADLPWWLYLAVIGGSGAIGAMAGHVVSWVQMSRFRPW